MRTCGHSMRPGVVFHFFGVGAFHDEGEWDQDCYQAAHDPEGVLEAQDVGLQRDLLRELG